MDTIIFLLIFAALLAFWTGRRQLGLALFGVSVLATIGLAYAHMTSHVPLSF